MGKNIVGFDFGENRLKMILCDGSKIKKTVAVDVPDNMMSDGAILSMDAMSAFIAEQARANGIPKGDASVVLSSAYVYAKAFSMPIMNHQQVLYNIPYEFADYLTEEKSLYTFDYMVYGTENDEDGKPTAMRVFACASLKSVVEDYKAMFKSAGFKLKLVIPAEYACANVLKLFIEKTKAESADYCLLDLGYAESRLFIHKGYEHVQRRNIQFGMKQLTQIIADSLQVDTHIAENYKRTNFNNLLESEFANNFYDNLALEVMKTINFYNYNNRESELRKVYILGGGSAIPNIATKIRELANVEVCSASLLLPSSPNLKDPESFALAFGGTL